MAGLWVAGRSMSDSWVDDRWLADQSDWLLDDSSNSELRHFRTTQDRPIIH